MRRKNLCHEKSTAGTTIYYLRFFSIRTFEEPGFISTHFNNLLWTGGNFKKRLCCRLTISTIAAGCGVNNAEAKQPVESNTQTPFKDDFVLNEVTIDVLQQKKMQSGEYTSASITDKYLKRIDAIDKKARQLMRLLKLIRMH